MTDDEENRALAETRRTLPIALLRLREAVMERFRPMLSAHDITEQQWRVLRVLQELGSADATQLAKGACILGPSLTRILKALEARGLVSARRDPADKRRSIIELTEAGEGFIAAVVPESRKVYAEIEARLGPDRIEALLDELQDVLDVLTRD